MASITSYEDINGGGSAYTTTYTHDADNEDDVCNDTPPSTLVSPWGAPKGDIDDDCTATLADFFYFELCLSDSGPGEPPIFGDCTDAFDFDGDNDNDLQDFGAFQTAFQGGG